MHVSRTVRSVNAYNNHDIDIICCILFYNVDINLYTLLINLYFLEKG